jgi:Domain of Unknown Function (DUF1080)
METKPMEGYPIPQTGAVYCFAAPPFSKQIASKEAGQRNTFEVKVVDQSYTVILKNILITEFIGNRSLQGYIGLQNHDNISKVSFRNISIKRYDEILCNRLDNIYSNLV